MTSKNLTNTPSPILNSGKTLHRQSCCRYIEYTGCVQPAHPSPKTRPPVEESHGAVFVLQNFKTDQLHCTSCCLCMYHNFILNTITYNYFINQTVNCMNFDRIHVCCWTY